MAAAESTGAGISADARGYRLDSIDMLRGLVIVIMALDHARDYYASAPFDPTDMAETNLAYFLTRWITHFCAPVFVFLAGTSAGLMAARKSKRELGRFLLTRGLWLIFIEATLVSFAWTFNVGGLDQIGGGILISAQVIWAIGASMVVLAALQWLPTGAVLAVGAAIVLGHNLLDPLWPGASFGVPLPLFDVWIALHHQLFLQVGPLVVVFMYPLLPWIGVMALGFGLARVFRLPDAKRRKVLLYGGLAATGLFLLLRAVNGYGEPAPWAVQERGGDLTLASFLNLTKYPPSLQFLLMTLGPSFVLLAWAERWRGAVMDALVTFGRVPFFFYVIHLYLIHASALLLGVAQGRDASAFLTFWLFFPDGYGVGLWGIYLGWVLVVAALYPPCKWFAGVKKRRKDWWLSYL